MMFVLAAMLLLMAIGVSALVAAGASYGASLAKRAENQLDLYVNSMELTLREVLMDASDVNMDIEDNPTTLTGQILKMAYEHVKDNSFGNYPYTLAPIEITPDIPDDWDVSYSISVTGTFSIMFTKGEPASWVYLYTSDAGEDYYDLIMSRIRQEASINGSIIITITATSTIANVTRTTATATTYGLDNASIKEDSFDPQTPRPSESYYLGAMLITSPGTWTFQRHESFDYYS
ncbi:MAG: hypothetical protein LBI19_07475 [Oscillospiraceae bacterium]|jgi:hypothetical protein|nr:hypothetical protein [Oscillospiraceae bacterium]